MTTFVLLLALTAPDANPKASKVDPEPPRRTVVGTWRGDWNGTAFTAVFSERGLYYEEFGGGTRFAGRWVRGACWRDVSLVEAQVPLGEAAPTASIVYRFRLSSNGMSGSCTAGGVRMKRVK